MRQGSTRYYIMSDHLGSTSITTNSSGTLVAELRYKAWGETRYTSGTPKTNYKYTGQREEASFGLYFYNARWYDPALGRFAQADSIVPGGVQGLDRYAYTNNNPIRYIDPSGHNSCKGAVSGYKCNRELKKSLTQQSNLPDYGGYLGCGGDAECLDGALGSLGISQWEYDILSRLYFNGGSDAVHGVNYILANGIHIKVGEPFSRSNGRPGRSIGDWQDYYDIGGWWVGKSLIVLDPGHNEPGKMPENGYLAVVIHEALHIEQGPDIAFSKAGEMQAGQVGLEVYMALEGKKRSDLTGRDARVYDATTVTDYHAAFQGESYWWNLFILPTYPGWHDSPIYP